MEYSSLDDVPHSVRMNLQQQQQHQIMSPAFSIITDSSPHQSHFGCFGKLGIGWLFGLLLALAGAMLAVVALIGGLHQWGPKTVRS